MTPRDLFYHNALLTPAFSIRHPESYPSVSTIPNNTVYDTIPGDNADKKREYLKTTWGQFIGDVKVERDNSGGYNRYHFWLSIDGKKFSLTLFGRFEEEERLAQAILTDLATPAPPVPRSRLSEALTPAPQ